MPGLSAPCARFARPAEAAAAGFTFAYGPGSFRRHSAEARRLAMALRVVREPSLAWDVDVPADLLTTA